MHHDRQWREEPLSKTAICTLFEGDYHFGLAAFLNTLARVGYSGTLWVGYRGELPPWLDQLRRLDAPGEQYAVAEQVRIVFLLLTTDIHLTQFKPEFMLRLLANEAQGCEYIWYFDPDIFLRSAWSFFAGWQTRGIALCQEITSNILPADSPLRHMWIDAGEALGFSDPRPLNHYFNGGAVGVAAQYSDFLRNWKRLIEYAASTGHDLKLFMSGTRESPFYAIDQDALNVAAMYSKFPLSTVGPEGMGFIPGAVNMYHCVGQKPWRGSVLLRALRGVPPSNATKYLFSQVDSPISPYSSIALKIKRIGCAAAALLGRFYARR
jgi:hypothetical protein